MKIEQRVPDPQFVAGWVEVRDVRVGPSSPALVGRIDALVAERAATEFPPEALKQAVRGLLRRGGFTPSGRNKPASEYLAQAAREGRFPRINNLVDAINLFSLRTAFPISLLDLDETGGGLVLRRGEPGEKYVFNASGQEIELEGLLCACAADGTALANPVKDSMRAKLKPGTSSVVAVIYATREALDDPKQDAELERIAAELGVLLKVEGGATSTRSGVV